MNMEWYQAGRRAYVRQGGYTLDDMVKVYSASSPDFVEEDYRQGWADAKRDWRDVALSLSDESPEGV